MNYYKRDILERLDKYDFYIVQAPGIGLVSSETLNVMRHGFARHERVCPKCSGIPFSLIQTSDLRTRAPFPELVIPHRHPHWWTY